MTRHTIKATLLPEYAGLIGLVDVDDNNRVIGEERPYLYPSKIAAYKTCAAFWPGNSTWQGRKEHAGYTIEVD